MAEWKEKSFISFENGKEIRLQGKVSLRSQSGRGIIVFATGISGHFDDYMKHFLNPLAEALDVVTFNHRGHGKSEGRFNPYEISSDISNILKCETTEDDAPMLIKHSLLAHSIGSLGIDGAKKVFLINPYIGKEYLPLLQKVVLYFTKTLDDYGIAKKIQDNLSVDFKKKRGFHNYNFISDYAMLIDTKFTPSVDCKIGFCLSDKDEIIGYRSSHHREFATAYLKSLGGEDYSHLVSGLNHCLNTRPFELTPFMKEEKEKNMIPFIEAIASFYRK